MDSPPSEPPAYSDSAAPLQPPASAAPPGYDEVTEALPRDQLVSGDLPCLLMDGCIIYAASQPSRPLYELSNSPATAEAKIYAIEKFMYRLSSTDGEGTVYRRKRHLYDLRNNHAYYPSRVYVDAQVSSRFAYQETELAPGITVAMTPTWLQCKVEGHFKADQSVKQRLSNRSQLDWKNMDGTIVATEKRLERDSEGSVRRLPRLNLRVSLEALDFDFLVTLWAARVWKESHEELKEGLSWKKFKRIASTSTGSPSTRLSGVGAVR